MSIAGIALSAGGFTFLFLIGPVCFAVWLWVESKRDYRVQVYHADPPSPATPHGGGTVHTGSLD